MKSIHRVLAALALAGGAASAPAQPADRGELLYTTHCIACHTTQVHWRDQHRATDWPSLVAQVRRWQGAVGLGWSDADITAVARHLDARIYRFPPVQRQADRR